MKEYLIVVVVLSLTILKMNAQDMERKSPNITASFEIMIDAPIDTVWQVLAMDYAKIEKWASGVSSSVGSGKSLNGSTCSERSCEITAAGFNDTKEKILRFDPDNYYLEYDLYHGLPGFVRYSVNKDRLEERNGKTLWISDNEMRVGGFIGATMKGLMRKNLGKVLQYKGEELKHYIEKGRPHQRKLEVMAKLEKKKLFVLEQEISAPIENVWQVIAMDFPSVADSHPVSPRSEFIEGCSQIKVGSKRIMYMSKNGKKYFKDEITHLDSANHEISINAYEASGYPMNFASVDFFADQPDEDRTNLTLVFTYQTKPRFLQGMARGSLKKQLQDYLFAIDHHANTGEVISEDNWKRIRKTYR